LVAEQRFDQPLPNLGTDEIGQFVTAFGNMRGKLHSHLQEINRLLLVSQGIASNLELESSVKPILETALAAGASFSRLVLTSAAQPDFDEDTPARFGHGPNAQAYSSLDSQLLELTQQQDVVSLTNPARAGLTFDPNTPPLDSILAVALRHENANYGALWVAYPESHKISEEQIRFITTVAGQAALAASNTRLFLSALIGRQRLEAILSSTPDPVLVTDYKDRLLIANPAALDLLNAGAQPQQGLPIDAIIKQTALLDLLRASDNEPKTAEITFPDKRVFFASSSAVTADNQQMGRVCVMRDITSLKELDALKTDFVNTVSHDLRAPLTLMRGYATMIQMVGELNAQQHDYVEKIVSGVEGMAGLVNSLLDLGRIESGIGGLQVGKVSVQEIAENIVEALQVRADQKQITLSIIHGQVSLPHVEADRHLLQQALHNLVENAIQYTDNGGQVRIELTVHEDGVLFAVGDTGMGIAPVDIPRLFERFYRVSHPDSSVQRGSGLGLAIVKSIAERHGGRVWAESQLGSGSTFYFLVPLRQPGI
ncbi:MAG: ATP-binding protein, partial [Anaerolineae bacterium]|nr:ATP-binding protein [Anaerolineae bacterium]